MDNEAEGNKANEALSHPVHKRRSATPPKQMWTLRLRSQRAQSGRSLVLSLANRGSHAPPSGALEGRRLAPREPRARSARQSVPLVANGLLLREVAKLRENLLPGSDPAHGELVLPLRLADLEKRLRRREQPASLLKRSDALRKRGPPKLVDVPL